MSDPSQNAMLAMLMANDQRLSKTEVKEVPPLYLPWSQRSLNPFPLASSGGAWGDSSQPWAVNVLSWNLSVFVVGTNNATNYWTIILINGSGATLATLDTHTPAVLTPGTWNRLATTSVVQPSSSNAVFSIVATATLSPGAIYILPALALLRTGN